MVSENTRNLANVIKNSIKKSGVNYNDLSDLLDVAIHAMNNEDDVEWALKVSDYVKKMCDYGILHNTDILQLDALYWRVIKVEAYHKFESYLYYMEKNRTDKKKFYLPREKTLKVVVDDLQDLEDGIIEFYGLSLPPRVGKSTICIFFLTWAMGRHPDLHNAMGGHSGILAKGFYKEALNIITSAEYTWSEIFPNVKLENKSADEFTVNLNTPDRFATLTCRGIEGTWTGAIDISSDGYLYVDDLIRDRTESLSPIRLENRYQDYLNVMVDRKNDGAKELMVGTRWNILDPLGRNEEKFKGNQKARFRKIPALNEHDESNFDYKFGLGFSTEYYKNLRDRLDKNEWEAKYQQRPFVREGILLPSDELRTYNGVLPDGEFAIGSACDVAFGGGDSLSMPFGYMSVETGDIYITGWIFNKGDKTVTKPLVVAKMMQYKPNMTNFEGNNGGHEYADDIDRLLREKGFRTNITSRKADNQVSKLAKIIQYAPDIRQRCVFLKEELRDEEYRNAMDEITTFTQIGKNPHDDGIDSLVQLLQVFDDGLRIAKVINSPV